MLNSWQWRANYMYSAWIYSGQYIVVLSYERDFEEVVEAVRDKALELGVSGPTPLICINACAMERDHMSRLQEEGMVSVVLD